MNTIACKECNHFSQEYKYVRGKRSDAWYGWCKKLSVYPTTEWDPGRPFDLDVKRVTRNEDRSAPVIVDKDGLVPDCTFAMRK